MACQYCENQETFLTYPLNNNPNDDVQLNIRNSFGEHYLNLEATVEGYGYYQREISIHFCPFCGEELD